MISLDSEKSVKMKISFAALVAFFYPRKRPTVFSLFDFVNNIAGNIFEYKT